MNLPSRLTFYGGEQTLNGRTLLDATDEHGVRHLVYLTSLFARLYFDGEPIPVSSPIETELLHLLRKAQFDARVPPWSGSLVGLVGDVIRYIEAHAYGSLGPTQI